MQRFKDIHDGPLGYASDRDPPYPNSNDRPSYSRPFGTTNFDDPFKRNEPFQRLPTPQSRPGLLVHSPPQLHLEADRYHDITSVQYHVSS